MATSGGPSSNRKRGPPHTLRYEDYTIGWICALPEEAKAAIHMLDGRDDGRFPFRHGDDNQYTAGEIAGHKVVITCLPKRAIATVAASALVAQMRQSFPNLRYGLLVGIGGGVPGRNSSPDIRLGDVVVASPSDTSISPVGIIGYELGAETVDGFKIRDWQAPTHQRLRAALESIERDTGAKGPQDLLDHLDDFRTHEDGQQFCHPEVEDQLYEGDDTDNLVPRRPRLSRSPAIHYGLIASGNKAIKNATLRDALRDKYVGIICFEMEAAGLMNIMPVAVIRGICDYADSRKNDVWHHYAAATAAAYAKSLLNAIGPELTPYRNG
ncbi:purine and uridine phosphorylase [Hypoxylon sp. FL1857]|nr:purine and uridine phosphorylase [Hypoxylon sp. FL1857]